MAASYGQSIGRATLGGNGGINGGGNGGQLQSTYLPNGACGYRDLSGGPQAPTCGCRRFWLNTSAVVREESERTSCFCGHHACFHDFVSLGLPNGNTQDMIYGSQMRSPGFNQAGYTAPTWSQLMGDTSVGATNGTCPATYQPPAPPTPVQQTPVDHQNPLQTPLQYTPGAFHGVGLGIGNNAPPQSQPQSQSINTRLWQALNGFARDQDNGSNSGNSSKLPSTAVPSVVDEPQVSNVPAASTARQFHSMAPPLNIPSALTNEARPGDIHSATEVATPSVRGTPDFHALAATGAQGVSPSAPQSRQSHRNTDQVISADLTGGSRAIDRRASSVGPSLSIQEMCNTIQNFGQRIDQLESMSFAHLPSDEVIDRFDMVDGRLMDLENWRTEQDKADENNDVDERFESFQNRVLDLEQWREDQDAQPSHDSDSPRERAGRHFLPETSSFASDGSFDSDAAAQTETIVLATLAANAETGPRIDALESRLTELEESAMPSYIRPWHVQIVLLPFGRQLPGIWFSSTESSRQSQRRSASRASEEWNGPLESHSFTAKNSFPSSASENAAWTTASIEEWARSTQEEWLSAKACGPSGAVFQRLESRGLVRDIEITSPNARHIWSSISEALGDVLGNDNEHELTSTSTLERYHALKQPFVPLRKARKSSRLRFLSPAEMLTCALWTAEFLDSSAMMKLPDGQRRLYLTTPEAYIQPSTHKFWSWPALRSLPMYGADGEIHAAQVVGNVIEACWSYNDRLDHRAASLHSSFADQISISDSDNERDQLSHSVPITKLRRSSTFRSASMPTSQSPPVARFPIAPPPSSSPHPVAAANPKRRDREVEHKADKRRRVSSLSSRNSSSSALGPLGSPELHRGGVNFTPRWSREPLSPYTGGASSNPARGSSPAEFEDHGILLGRRSVGAFPAGSREGLNDHINERRGRAASGTPFAYATPHSGVMDDGTEGGGDTEVEDEDDDDGAESETSWPGWDDGMEV
ncbi:uncharacterized protein MYCGRDRAFT_109766 [Zymoseptoria tritici IPO323]|uniref:Uncharacterized protein n=1 Tax=Zymoseptoria tritici (strain CBS 115943 / IPO323) TaxID=336722 RepID=F9XCV1_ZYMTI|nr:uncharacterized protein MYCGRDRAFT_109766 [Zymoseptoria tritici IPO323]EGP86374.1 hypothetical protein MYCGRDRAFT_109766 [Zymoseptoria tritici IPO323]